MCLFQAITFLCKHTVTKSTDCSPAQRDSARHTISRRDLTPTELCPDCRPSRPKKYHKSRSIKDMVLPKLRRARRTTKTFSSQESREIEKQPPQKLDAKAIKRAQSLTGACLRSTKSNPDVIAMINKEMAKNRSYAASLISSSSSDSSIRQPSSVSSQVGDRRASTPTGKDLAWLSGHVGYGPNQSPLDDRKPLLTSQAIETRSPTPPVQDLESLSGYVAYSPNQSSLNDRNNLPSQRPTNHKSTASMPNLLKIGTGMAWLTEEDLGASARRGSRAEEQAKEFHNSCYNGSSSASPSAHVELPGSEIPQVPSRFRRPLPAELAVGHPSKIRPSELAASAVPSSRTRGPTSKASHPSNIPALLQPGYVEPDQATRIDVSPIPALLKPGYQEPDRATRMEPFTTIPDILLTAPTPPSPSPSDTRPTAQPLVSRPLTPALPLSPILTSKRGQNYQTMNLHRSKNEIMRDQNGHLVPRFAGQALPIIGVRPTHREQNQSVARNSPILDADLQDTELLFGFADEYSARGKKLGDARGTGRVSEPHYGFLNEASVVDKVDDKSSLQKSGCRQSWWR
ncbi:hypothetical protein HYALB_00005779 [Hymenoscyphus albidus]|uniref:Uncharacterized protein n=1 Tax=Hymenoscyphus albidus TaxID=595503 RepID=A0A9N9Q7S3_9HELO|nr:hypothetical protein HYALB_00005779 [Hymenoscyphus albidus]